MSIETRLTTLQFSCGSVYSLIRVLCTIDCKLISGDFTRGRCRLRRTTPELSERDSDIALIQYLSTYACIMTFCFGVN